MLFFHDKIVMTIELSAMSSPVCVCVCVLGMGIVENSTVRFGSPSTVRFYHGFLNGLLMTFL